MKPLKLPRRKAWKGLDPMPCGLFTCVVIVLVLFTALLLMPGVRHMQAAEDAMCADTLDFVFTANSLGALAVLKTPPDGLAPAKSGSEMRALQEAQLDVIQ